MDTETLLKKLSKTAMQLDKVEDDGPMRKRRLLKLQRAIAAIEQGCPYSIAGGFLVVKRDRILI